MTYPTSDLPLACDGWIPPPIDPKNWPNQGMKTGESKPRNTGPRKAPIDTPSRYFQAVLWRTIKKEGRTTPERIVRILKDSGVLPSAGRHERRVHATLRSLYDQGRIAESGFMHRLEPIKGWNEQHAYTALPWPEAELEA